MTTNDLRHPVPLDSKSRAHARKTSRSCPIALVDCFS
jgi:hypothetical protein